MWHTSGVGGFVVLCSFYCCGFRLPAWYMKWQKDRSPVGSGQQEPFELHSHAQSRKARTKTTVWEEEHFSTQKNNNKKPPKFGKDSEVLQWKECILCNFLTFPASYYCLLQKSVICAERPFFLSRDRCQNRCDEINGVEKPHFTEFWDSGRDWNLDQRTYLCD